MSRKDSYTNCKLWDIHMFANTDSGEGFVNIGEDFYYQGDLWQIDVINDWIHDLSAYKEVLLEEFRNSAMEKKL